MTDAELDELERRADLEDMEPYGTMVALSAEVRRLRALNGQRADELRTLAAALEKQRAYCMSDLPAMSRDMYDRYGVLRAAERLAEAFCAWWNWDEDPMPETPELKAAHKAYREAKAGG